MNLTKLLFALVAGLFVSFLSTAQPNPYGCHHWRKKPPKHHPLTEAEKDMINESIARSDTFDILHYVINIDVTDYNNDYIRASTAIQFSPLMANQTFIRFDLYNLQVDSVTNENGLLSHTYDGNVVKVLFDEIPAVGEIHEVTVHYQGSPYRDPYWGGFYFESNYIYNLGIGLTTIPPNFGKVWYPCFDSFVERATYEYHVKSSGTFRAVCQGMFMGEEQLAGDTIVRSYLMDTPITTHISAIAVANYENYEFTHSGAYGDIPVRLTAKPNQINNMVSTFADLGGTIDALEYWYGQQPFDQIGYVYTTDGALEIPGNIAYPEFMGGQTNDVNRDLYAHELGHHWWGDIVVMHIHNDMWMKEGPAEYSSHLAVEWVEGEEEFIETVKDNQLYVLEEAHIADEGFHPLSGIPDEWIYGVHTYNKGAAVMHNLRGYLGDDLFRQGMTGVQANYAFQDMTADEFKLALEDQTGYDLDPFFNAWIFEPGFSTFVVDSALVQPDGDNYQVEVFVQQKLRATDYFHEQVPLDLTFISEDRERVDYQITCSGEFTTVTVSSPFVPAMVVLNGYNRLNQARMDYEAIIEPEGSFFSTLPWVDFKVYDEIIVDTTFVRVEHIWSAPDDEHLGEGIFEVSQTHYWKIDGIWPEGSLFEGRANYQAVDETDLDYDLFEASEGDAILIYRETPADDWEVYPDFTVNAGNLFNGTGYIHLDVLRKGEYAFANGDESVAISEPSVTEMQPLTLYPVPADDQLTVSGTFEGEEVLLMDVIAADGRVVMRSSMPARNTFTKTLDVSLLAGGTYIVRVRTVDGTIVGTSAFTRNGQ